MPSSNHLLLLPPCRHLSACPSLRTSVFPPLHPKRSVMRGGTEIRYQDICRVLTSLASPLKKEGYFIASLQTSRLSDLSQLDLVKSVPIGFFSLYPDFQLIRRDGPGLNGTMTVWMHDNGPRVIKDVLVIKLCRPIRVDNEAFFLGMTLVRVADGFFSFVIKVLSSSFFKGGYLFCILDAKYRPVSF